MRSRLAVAVVSAVVATSLSGCGVQAHRSPDPKDAVPAWQRLPDPPLSARTGPVVTWTGSDVLVVGGDTGPQCPPNADCALPAHFARDGARLDVGARTWHSIADAPVEVPSFAPNALVGDTWFLLANGVLLAFDVADDSWSRVPTPATISNGQLVAAGDLLVVVSGTDEHGVEPDRIFDADASRWSVLPDDPIGPAFDRVLTAIPSGLVLTAHELVDNPGGDGHPSLVLAARYDMATGAWTRLPDSDQIGGWGWTWTGRRLVDASLGGADGGEVGNYGRTIPNGGVLDPATGRWSHLPHAPDQSKDGWPVSALGGRFAAVGGWTYDDDSRSWAVIPVPSGAPKSPGTAVWAGDRLVVIGGIDAVRGDAPGTVSGTAWISQSGATLGRPLL